MQIISATPMWKQKDDLENGAAYQWRSTSVQVLSGPFLMGVRREHTINQRCDDLQQHLVEAYAWINQQQLFLNKGAFSKIVKISIS